MMMKKTSRFLPIFAVIRPVVDHSQHPLFHQHYSICRIHTRKFLDQLVKRTISHKMRISVQKEKILTSKMIRNIRSYWCFGHTHLTLFHIKNVVGVEEILTPSLQFWISRTPPYLILSIPPPNSEFKFSFSFYDPRPRFLNTHNFPFPLPLFQMEHPLKVSVLS